GGYLAFWQGVTDSHPAMALAVTGDQYGISWGNFGMRRMGEEPRATYNNRASESADYKQVVDDPWFGCLSAISTANDILNALGDGITVDNGGDADKSLEAGALFLRGIARGYVGLIFDRGYIVDEDTDLTQTLEFRPYTEIIASAVSDMEAAIVVANTGGDDFSHGFFNGVTMDAAQVTALAHSYAARFLTQWPRTEAENATVNWTAVQSHASQGIDFDFGPNADGNFWISYHRWAFADTGQGGFWALVDQRLVSAMDPSQPSRYPTVNGTGASALTDSTMVSDDDRAESDFVFSADHGAMPVDRGEWHFSHYKHNRNLSDPGFSGDGSSSGPMPVFLAADNDLLLAEAELALGNKATAVGIINAGTRVTRGNLAPLNATDADAVVLEAIMYERAIELLSTGPGGMWFDRRRVGPRVAFDAVGALDGLQLQTPAQLPVPAVELSLTGIAPYNFGGEQDPQGINAF
ncbi:MAG: RagB/SusD family nutrient uptake outer membrane protein, partial [Bacteroidota bacterium]